MPKQKPNARKLNDRVVVLREGLLEDLKSIPVVCKTSHTLGGALKKNPDVQATPQTS